MIPLTEINNNNTLYHPSEIIKTDHLLESEFNKISNKIENDGLKLKYKCILPLLFVTYIIGANISEFYKEGEYGPLIASFGVILLLADKLSSSIFNVIQLKKHSIPLDEIETDLFYQLSYRLNNIPYYTFPGVSGDITDKIKAKKIIADRKAIQPLLEKAYNCVRFMLFTEAAKENDIPQEVAKLIGTQLSELK